MPNCGIGCEKKSCYQGKNWVHNWMSHCRVSYINYTPNQSLFWLWPLVIGVASRIVMCNEASLLCFGFNFKESSQICPVWFHFVAKCIKTAYNFKVHSLKVQLPKSSEIDFAFCHIKLKTVRLSYASLTHKRWQTEKSKQSRNKKVMDLSVCVRVCARADGFCWLASLCDE